MTHSQEFPNVFFAENFRNDRLLVQRFVREIGTGGDGGGGGGNPAVQPRDGVPISTCQRELIQFIPHLAAKKSLESSPWESKSLFVKERRQRGDRKVFRGSKKR